MERSILRILSSKHQLLYKKVTCTSTSYLGNDHCMIHQYSHWTHPIKQITARCDIRGGCWYGAPLPLGTHPDRRALLPRAYRANKTNYT